MSHFCSPDEALTPNTLHSDTLSAPAPAEASPEAQPAQSKATVEALSQAMAKQLSPLKPSTESQARLRVLPAASFPTSTPPGLTPAQQQQFNEALEAEFGPRKAKRLASLLAEVNSAAMQRRVVEQAETRLQAELHQAYLQN